MTTFASRLRKIRIDAGLTQRELARQADIDVSQISRYEQSKGEPRPGVLKRIAEAMDTSAEWLATGNPDFDPELTNHVIKLELDEDIQKRVRAIAERTGRTVEDVLRTLVLEGIELLKDAPTREDADALLEQRGEQHGALPGTEPTRSTKRTK